MSGTLTVTELVRNFTEYVNRVVYRGERFRLTRGGKPVAELGPVPGGRSLEDLPDLVAGLPPLSDKEVEAFRADLEQARIELADVGVKDGCSPFGRISARGLAPPLILHEIAPRC